IVDDAWQVLEVMAGYDREDPFSRGFELGVPSGQPPQLHLGLPSPAGLEFFGDSAAADAFARARDVLERMGASICEIDMQPFFETASLVYDGPWIAERRAALSGFMADNANDMLPVTRSIVETADRFSAADAFSGIYKLAGLRRATEP